MRLSWPKVMLLWEHLSKHKSLFSDMTKGDVENFLRYLTSPDTLWLELRKNNELTGIMTLDGLYRVVDLEAHFLTLDRDLAGKVTICRRAIAWTFDNFAANRLTVQVPAWYHTTVRFAQSLGFRIEGKKRGAVLINGRWSDMFTLGLLRSEANGIHGKD